MPELRGRIAIGAAMRGLCDGQEARRGLYQERLRDAVAKELAAGQRIRRDFYHVEASPTRAGMGWSSIQGKENIPPKSVLRQARGRKSPLPIWYPRTPLRDITALLDEMERRRASLRSAACKRRRQHAELSPSSALRATPFPQKLCVSNADPNASDASDTHSTPIPSIICFPAIKGCPQMPSALCSAVQDDQELVERELKLEKSIEAIEKLVRQDLKRKPKESAKKTSQQRTLMSMR